MSIYLNSSPKRQIVKGWNELINPGSGDLTNGWRYNNAVWDVTEGAANEVFNEAYIRVLQAHAAFIANLFAKRIVLDIGGSIESADYEKDKSGFIIKANGEMEFNKGIFRGELDVGPLSVSNSPSVTENFTFEAGTKATAIHDKIGAEGSFPATGTYGSQSISRIEITISLSRSDEKQFIHGGQYGGASGYAYYYYKDYDVYVTIGGTKSLIAHTRLSKVEGSSPHYSEYNSNPLTSKLTVQLEPNGKTLKVNLPKAPQIPTESGGVYLREANEVASDTYGYVMMVKK